MRTSGLRCFLLTAALLASPVLPAQPAHAGVLVPSLAGEVTTLLPSVVAIKTIAMTPSGRMFFDGSGFIIDASGIIATNRHVIANANTISVIVPGIGPLPATALYISEGIDLALLKVDAGRPLPTVKFGDSDKAQIGDQVMLIGNPLGVGESVSVGVISALNKDIGETLYDHFFQTDAALNHGNSGGAMFNMAGEIIGINTGLTSSDGNTGNVGIGYTMPINDAKFIFDQFLRTGTVISGTAGVHGQKITPDLAEAFGMKEAKGAIITGVVDNGPSAGKVFPGDIILSVNSLDATDTRAVARLIALTPPGKDVEVKLLRGGTEMTVTIAIGLAKWDPKKMAAWLGREQGSSKRAATPSLPGMELSAIDAKMREQFGLDADQAGVVVTSVVPQSVAARSKFVAGDVILSVNGEAVSKPLDVQMQLRAAVDQKRQMAALLVAGERSTRWIALPVEADH
jgi:serine protease Do